MNLARVLLIAATNARELVRDRRTLFINLVLPVLLYPLFGLFAVQIAQLRTDRNEPPPRVLAIGVDASLRTSLAAKPDRDKAELAIIEASPAEAARFRALAASLPRLASQADAGPEAAARQLGTRQELLSLLRAHGSAAAIIEREDGLTLIGDDADRRIETVRQQIKSVVTRLSRERSLERLRAAGLEERDREPLALTMENVAPHAEAIRSRIASVVPLLLVMLAAVGAFYAALDLLPGERDRGTLEPLLVTQASRREIVLGKLLVCWASGLVSAAANLLSLLVTIGFLGAQLAKAGIDLGGAFQTAAPAILLLMTAALPLTLALSALALAVSGLAQSQREAQNLMSPLLLVVIALAAPGAFPGLNPSIPLDLVPITGLVVVLRSCLQEPTLPLLHLLVTLFASTSFALILVSWTAGLLDQEWFRYPGLVRAGWGRWRRWGAPKPGPGGLEAMALYAVAVATFTAVGALAVSSPAVVQVALPLICGALIPPLLLTWAGAFPPSTGLLLRLPSGSLLAGSAMLIPAAILSSNLIFLGQGQFLPIDPQEVNQRMKEVFGDLRALGGIPLLILVAAILPGIAEELLCRGALLSGLARGIGPVGAVLVSAFLFAALHGSPTRFLPQAGLGILLAVLALRTGSCIPGMVIHAGHNAVIIVIASYEVELATWAQLHLKPQWHAPLITIGLATTVALAAVGWRRTQPAPVPPAP